MNFKFCAQSNILLNSQFISCKIKQNTNPYFHRNKYYCKQLKLIFIIQPQSYYRYMPSICYDYSLCLCLTIPTFPPASRHAVNATPVVRAPLFLIFLLCLYFQLLNSSAFSCFVFTWP